MESINLIFNTNYYYTFVIKNKWHFNLGAGSVLGVDFNRLLYDDSENKTSQWSSAVIFNLKGHFGFEYNSKSYFGGISVQAFATARDEDSAVQYDNIRGILKIFIGYRFKSPKFVDKSFKWVEEKIH